MNILEISNSKPKLLRFTLLITLIGLVAIGITKVEGEYVQLLLVVPLEVIFFPFGLAVFFASIWAQFDFLTGGQEVPNFLIPFAILGWLVYVGLASLFVRVTSQRLSAIIYFLILTLLIANL